MNNKEYVELLHKDFEFRHKGKATRHYARGAIIKYYNDELCLVELFCNGKRYRVSKSILRRYDKEL